MGLLDAPVVLRETPGAKMRRKATAAEANNPLLWPAWNPLPAWAALTAYTAGYAVRNAGHKYVCVVPGTSAAATGPTTTNSGQLISDGSVSWSWLGPVDVTTADAQAPSLVVNASARAGLSNIYYPGVLPACFAARGASPVVVSTQWRMDVVETQPGTTDSGKGSYVEFETDADNIDIAVGSGSSNIVRFIVDGRYVIERGNAQTGSTSWYGLDFTLTGGSRRRRNIRVEFGKGSGSFLGSAVRSIDQIWAPDTTDDINAVFIGNSREEGSAYGPFLSGNTLPNIVAKHLGWVARNMSKGGTGWLAKGAGNAFYTYRERVAQALALNPDVLVFGDATNEMLGGYSAGQIAAEVAATIAAVRAINRSIPIIVQGCLSINNAGVAATEAAVFQGVSDSGDARTFPIPIYSDVSGPWITGAWNNSAQTTSVNAPLMIANDNVHSPDIGTLYCGARLAAAIRRRVLPNIR